MNTRPLTHAIIVLALIGVGLSAYSYLHNQGITSGEFCTIGDTFNCDIVNRSEYSKLAGIPVSLIGIVGYGLLLLGGILKRFNPQDTSLTIFLLGGALGGTLFALYLTSVEAFVLQAWCLICIASQITILLLLWCAYRLSKQH